MSDKRQQNHKRKARQAIVKAQHNRDEARRKLLRQREKLARRHARNRRQSEERRDDEAEQRENPTTRSTLPSQESNAENAARNSHSTVPKTVKYSKVTARERLYGLRLHRRSEGGDTTAVSIENDDTAEQPTDE